MEPLYSGNEILSFIERLPYAQSDITVESCPQGLICTTRVHLGLSEVAFKEGCPCVRGGLYEEFHSIPLKMDLNFY